jgi:hypothetical protein
MYIYIWYNAFLCPQIQSEADWCFFLAALSYPLRATPPTAMSSVFVKLKDVRPPQTSQNHETYPWDSLLKHQLIWCIHWGPKFVLGLCPWDSMGYPPPDRVGAGPATAATYSESAWWKTPPLRPLKTPPGPGYWAGQGMTVIAVACWNASQSLTIVELE